MQILMVMSISKLKLVVFEPIQTGSKGNALNILVLCYPKLNHRKVL